VGIQNVAAPAVMEMVIRALFLPEVVQGQLQHPVLMELLTQVVREQEDRFY
jgi:hypothetical protein